MSGRNDLAAELRAIMAERRERLGEPPTPEDLVDYRDGRLKADRRDEVEAGTDAFPEAAQALADLAAFPEVEVGEVREVTDDELDAGWEKFRARLDQHASPRSQENVSVARRRQVSGTRFSRPWLAVAAVLIFGVGLSSGLLLHRVFHSPADGPVLNAPIASLVPLGTDTERSVEGKNVEVPKFAGAWMLVLGVVDHLGPGNEYLAMILDAEDHVVWSEPGLVPTPAGTFHLGFDRAFLPSGAYRLVLSRGGTEREAIATYAFRLVLE